MKRLLLITLLISLALSAPSFRKTKKIVITSEFFDNRFLKHTAEHDIVKILFPVNSLNTNLNGSEMPEDQFKIFFVEADIVKGVKEYKGVSIIHKGQVKKLVETGTDVEADNGDSKTAYIAATDGLYKYNNKENSAEKYGSITDSLIGVVKTKDSDIIYVLTKDNELYKVTEEATKKEKMDHIVGAKQIILDYSYNLYYYGVDKKPYVVSKDGVKKIEGLPANPTEILLIKSPCLIGDGVPVILDKKAYMIYANGTSEVTDFEFEAKPTAYSMEAAVFQYYAYDKKIYEYNVLSILATGIFEEINNYFGDNRTRN